MRSLKHGYLWSCLASLISIALIYEFRILNALELSFHDTYFIVSTFHLAIGIFIICSLITFFALSIKARFRNMKLLLALIVHNLLAILGCFLLLYVFVSMVFAQSLFEIFQMADSEPLVARYFNKAIIVFAAVAGTLIIGEVILVRLAWKRSSRKKTFQ